jgi:hypothetical protein
VYVPAGVEAVVAMVSVLVPEEPGVRLMLAGENVKVMPVAVGETAAESMALPVSPRLSVVIVEVPLLPAVKLAGLDTLALIVKSPSIVTVTVAV